MKKIIVAFDGLRMSESARDFAIGLARQDNSRLTGVFLEDHAYHSYHIYDLITEEEGALYKRKAHLDKRDMKKRAASIAGFDKACKAAGVEYCIHKDRHVAIEELILESVYADLLVIDSSETISNQKQKAPTHFIHRLLPNVQCPVIVVPSVYRPINALTILYDGSPSSVHAVKMASYLLPEYDESAIEVIGVTAKGRSFAPSHVHLMKEFMVHHFPLAVWTLLKGDPEEEIIKALKKKKENVMVVLGAYQRSMVSRWFRQSMADKLIRNLKMPLFIAHYK